MFPRFNQAPGLRKRMCSQQKTTASAYILFGLNLHSNYMLKI